MTLWPFIQIGFKTISKRIRRCQKPFYPKQVSRIYFEDVDLIVFCTKNPKPIVPYLKEIHKPILFQSHFDTLQAGCGAECDKERGNYRID